MAVTKSVDFALSLNKQKAEWSASAFILSHGETIQRNYAALYFKRLGREEILARAVALGKIDPSSSILEIASGDKGNPVDFNRPGYPAFFQRNLRTSTTNSNLFRLIDPLPTGKEDLRHL